MACFSPSSCLVVFFLCLLASTSLASDIWLSPTGTLWTGSCLMTCTSSSPCGFPSGTYTETLSENCNLHFTPGDYSLSSMVLTLTGTTSLLNIYLENGNVSSLNFGITTPSPTIYIDGGDFYFIQSSITLSASTNGCNIQLTKSRFDSSSLVLGGSKAASLVASLSYFYLSNAIVAPFQWTAPGYSPVVTLNSISVFGNSNSPSLIHAGKLSSCAISNMNFQSSTLATIADTSTSVLDFGGSGSQLNTSSNSLLLGGTVGWEIRIHTPVHLTTASLSSQATLAQSGVRYFKVSQSSFFANIHLSLTSNADFDVYDAAFLDCNMTLSTSSLGSLFFSNSIVSITKDFGSLNFHSTNSRPHQILDVIVEIDTSQASRKPFKFQKNGIFTLQSPSSFSTNMLWLEENTQLVVNNISISEFIASTSGTAELRASSIQSPGYGPNTWEFHSIEVFNTLLNMSSLDILHYSATKPSLGIRSAIAPSPLALVVPPSEIIISWSLASETPSFGTRYPIYSNTTGLPAGGSQTGGGWNSSNFDQNFEIFPELLYVDSERTLYFQVKPISSNNQKCPPGDYPPQFECIDGQWVAIGDVEIPTIVLPPNGGSVLVLGNLTLGNGITFTGTGSSLVISGCVSVPKLEIVIEDSDDQQLTGKPFIILSQDPKCSNSLLNVALDANSRSKSCKKVIAKRDDQNSNSSTLSVLFELDSSQCNIKWIILGSVLGALFIIILTTVLLATFNKRFRNCIRPFRSRKESPTSS